MTAEQKLAMVEQAVAEGKVVYIQTSLRCTQIDAKVVARFRKVGAEVLRVRNGSLQMVEGRRFVCADHCAITIR